MCGAVCDVARRAGDYIAGQRRSFSFDRVEYKGTRDMVSYVDKEAEKMIVAELRQILPEAGFITEEGTTERAEDGQRYKWIIDPLDGTTNFIHGLPPFCVSLALTEEDRPVVGVVYEVNMRECFYAWKDSDAYLNGEKITVSGVRRMEDSLLAVGLSHSSTETIAPLLRNMDHFLRTTHGIRRIGSAAADLAYVACGRFDGFYQKNLSPWDVAAGALIVERAGGTVTDFSGGSDYLFGREIIACSPAIYPDFRNQVIKP